MKQATPIKKLSPENQTARILRVRLAMTLASGAMTPKDMALATGYSQAAFDSKAYEPAWAPSLDFLEAIEAYLIPLTAAQRAELMKYPARTREAASRDRRRAKLEVRA